ncbi:polysaccharide deacetylase family protein [uncultured Polaribacter sp.]|uniref:polysaccharide deacetylase family protein n=1 Tax=uncultured Polaribacter sp. TaxID=174711 RepID=UPI00261DBD94|nr:polysaccharide deacetylase family protein [uncultured Polaribacter sp.]
MRFFSNYIWRFSMEKKEIFLTFDDGPTPQITPFVLQELKKHNAKATFFCIGKNIKNHPELFKELIEQGHVIGNHTQNHVNGWTNNTKGYIDNCLKCDATIQQFSKNPTTQKLFRPPYGKIKTKQAKQLIKKGYKIIMWSVLSADFDSNITKETCLKNVLKNTKNGSIIVFHDSIKASEKLRFVLPKVLDYFSKKGYVFKSINT